MNNLVETAKEEIVSLEKKLGKINDFLAHAPEGSLKWQNRRKKIYYYQQYMEQSEKKWRQRYITSENVGLAKDLAKKQYYHALQSVIEKRLNALKRLIRDYPLQELDALYDDLCDERKKLVESIEQTTKERVTWWWDEPYEKNNGYLENVRYETEQGDRVRSKSEVIIANILYKYRKDILYKYEKPLQVVVGEKRKKIYPDFTIINVHTGKLFYWEHAGLMDDALYAGEFVKKMNVYIQNGLLPGRDLVMTFETQENPLDIGVVKQLIKSIIEG